MSKKSLMTIGAHADDNEFCFGATMLKYHEKLGYDIVYVQSTNNMSGGWAENVKGPRAGLSPLPSWITQKRTKVVSDSLLKHTVPWYNEMHQRKKEAAEAARELFHTEPIHLDYAQRHYTDRDLNKVDLRYGAPAPEYYDPAEPTIITAAEFPGAVERLKKLILEKNPEVVLTHSPIDNNPEHSSTSRLVRNAFRLAQVEENYDGSLLCQVTSMKGFGDFFDRWNSFIDTSGFFDKKRQAIGKHACQIPDPDKLDLWDQAVGQVCGGLESAEPFVVIQLSKTRGGPLTEEFTTALKYCTENWNRMFFSPESRAILDQFFDQYRKRNKIARTGGTAWG